MKNYKNIIYALCCLSYCIVIGGAVYEHLAVIPQWSKALPASLSMFQGDYGLNPEPFWANVHPITLLLYAVSLLLFWKTPRRIYVMVPFLIYFFILVLTFIYFVPELLEIINTPYATNIDESLTARGKLWENLSLIRLVVIMAAALYLFIGMAKPETKTIKPTVS